jgi:GNAT superfamily N-acetyltransferase
LSVALLDNIFWNALAGAQAHFAVGTDRARRFAPGFSPIVGFAEQQRPDFEALRPFCAPGEHFYCDGWSGPVPTGWTIDAEATMFKMVWDAPMPADDAAPDAVPLAPEHYPQALALATLTNPGPFGPRTPELGEYFGLFEGGRLVAMAGERTEAGPMREVSGVCTHPDYQGRGLAKQLIGKLIRRHMARGDTSFLHVMRANPAHQLYLDMGFEDYLESVVRVVVREETPDL